MIDLEKAPSLLRHAVDALDAAFSGDGAPDPFADLRQSARDAFEAKGLPTTRDEAWKYTDLRPALKPAYAPAAPAQASDAALAAAAIPGFDAARVVVVNGRYDASQSDLSGLPQGVIVGSLAETLANSPQAIADTFGRHVDLDRDAFASLNSASATDGLYVSVPNGVAVERPIHVVHLVVADAPTFVQGRNLIVVGRASEVRIVETFGVTGGAETFRNDLTEIVASDAAVVRHVRVQDEGDQAHGVSLVQTYQEKDSDVSTLTFTFASGTVRNNTVMVPAGLGGQSTLGGLYICHGSQHVDTNTLVDHVAPGCQSNELFKGILYDQSTGVFNGKVFVQREAQQTNAYQQSQGVILSPDAHHYSKPELEIYADDVKCSHGSTTGAVEPEHIFYLRSRGVSESDARAMLLYAFAHDVVEMVSMEPVRDWLDARIAERLT
ncbi:Fe-S cluster assembly protein SufD [Rubrivirga sp. IMCC43871]|uniref:Fe-S cluster assembly protein SufD n=1 Tax=Rubrivirga sp. IMCC43871 TaxID=3391575 RepID=UPI00398FE93E